MPPPLLLGFAEFMSPVSQCHGRDSRGVGGARDGWAEGSGCLLRDGEQRVVRRCRAGRLAERKSGGKEPNPVHPLTGRPPPGLLSTAVWTVRCAVIHGEKRAENWVEA